MSTSKEPSNVHSFAEAKLKSSTHVEGNVLCMACDATWVAIAPVGTILMECPHCNLKKAIWMSPILPQDEPMIQCGTCRNIFLIVGINNVYCPNCGEVVVDIPATLDEPPKGKGEYPMGVEKYLAKLEAKPKPPL